VEATSLGQGRERCLAWRRQEGEEGKEAAAGAVGSHQSSAAVDGGGRGLGRVAQMAWGGR
jgi:hypothetical protein